MEKINLYSLTVGDTINRYFNECRNVLTLASTNKENREQIIDFLNQNINSFKKQYVDNPYIQFLNYNENPKDTYENFILACSLPAILSNVNDKSRNEPINQLTKEQFEKYVFLKKNGFTDNKQILYKGIFIKDNLLQSSIILKQYIRNEGHILHVLRYLFENKDLDTIIININELKRNKFEDEIVIFNLALDQEYINIAIRLKQQNLEGLTDIDIYNYHQISSLILDDNFDNLVNLIKVFKNDVKDIRTIRDILIKYKNNIKDIIKLKLNSEEPKKSIYDFAREAKSKAESETMKGGNKNKKKYKTKKNKTSKSNSKLLKRKLKTRKH